MSLKYRPFAVLGFTLLLSLFTILYFSYNLSVIFISAGALLLFVSFLFKNLREKIVPLYVASAMIIAGISSYLSCSDIRLLHDNYVDKTTPISGTLSGGPEYENSRYYYIIDLESIDGQPIDGKIRLSVANRINAEPYDTVSLSANIYKLASKSKEVQRYYYSKGIRLGAFIPDEEDIILTVTPADKGSFDYFIFKTQKKIISNISEKLPNEAGSTVIAMLLGDKSGLSDDRIESFREAGVAPIFAVSGLHLSIWVLGLYSVLSQFNVKRKINSIIGIAFTVVFIFLAALSPSVCRAGLMMIVMLSAGLFRRKSDSLNSLGFAAFVLCIINPFTAVDTGFLLSFSATFGIVTIVPLIDKLFLSKLPENVPGRVLKSILTALCVGISASVAVIPATILFIGRISVYSVISNLLLSYVATVCMVAGGFSAITFPLSFISDFLALVAGLCAKFMLAVIDFICSTSFTTFSVDNLFWEIGAISSVCVLIFSLITFKGLNVFKSFCVSLALIVSVLGVSSYYYYNGLKQFRILNVGSGVSVVVNDTDSKLVLTGDADNYLKSLKIDEKLNQLSTDDPDLIIFGDPEAAYDKSNLKLLRNFDFNSVILPDVNKDISTLVNSGDLIETSFADVDIFNGDSVRININKKFSLAYYTSGTTKILLLFDNVKKAEIPSEYLDADYLVCCGYIPQCINPAEYERVIICGNTDRNKSVYDYVLQRGGNPIFSDRYDELIINIREDRHKLLLMEE
jgi:competence protein ComEC